MSCSGNGSYPDRHVIIRDHVDLYEFARDIGALEGGAR